MTFNVLARNSKVREERGRFDLHQSRSRSLIRPKACSGAGFGTAVSRFLFMFCPCENESEYAPTGICDLASDHIKSIAIKFVPKIPTRDLQDHGG
jgi:hypothetical protein